MSYKELATINVAKMTEKKGQLTYLSWAHAWAAACEVCTPTRKVYKDDQGRNYHTDGKTCWVEVGVTIDEVEYIDMLPVMNHRNQSITAEAVTSMDVNKAIQRSTTKALALHGLGLNVYAGEDLPMVVEKNTMHASNVEAFVEWVNGKGYDIDTAVKAAHDSYKVSDKVEALIVKAMEV